MEQRRVNMKALTVFEHATGTCVIEVVDSRQVAEMIGKRHDHLLRDILLAHATKELTGEFLLPLPKAERRTYSATEIGTQLGVSAHKIGTIANQHNLKTSEYGEWVVDKARHASKEVQSFRYYDSIVPILRAIIGGDSNEG